MDVPLYVWAATLGVIAAMLALDLLVLHREAHEVSMREAALTSAMWVALGVSFGVGVWAVAGGEYAGEYFAGYLIEKSLSVDNIFVLPSSSRTSPCPRRTSTGFSSGAC